MRRSVLAIHPVLTTPPATHRTHELQEAKTIAAGLPSPSVAGALAIQERRREALVDVAIAHHVAAPSLVTLLRQRLATLVHAMRPASSARRSVVPAATPELPPEGDPAAAGVSG